MYTSLYRTWMILVPGFMCNPFSSRVHKHWLLFPVQNVMFCYMQMQSCLQTCISLLCSIIYLTKWLHLQTTAVCKIRLLLRSHRKSAHILNNYNDDRQECHPLNLRELKADRPWPWPFTLTLKQGNSEVKTRFFGLRPWPTMPRSTLIPKIKVIGQTVQPWEVWQTGRRTDRQMDRCYQVHYLPRFAVNNKTSRDTKALRHGQEWKWGSFNKCPRLTASNNHVNVPTRQVIWLTMFAGMLVAENNFNIILLGRVQNLW